MLISPQVGEDYQIKRFLRVITKFYQKRPPLPKYHVTWNPTLVLDYVGTCYPNEKISLEMLTRKLSKVMALITAHRVQTFSLIEVRNIQISEKKKKKIEIEIEIKVPARIKTTAPNKYQLLLII